MKRKDFCFSLSHAQNQQPFLVIPNRAKIQAKSVLRPADAWPSVTIDAIIDSFSDRFDFIPLCIYREREGER